MIVAMDLDGARLAVAQSSLSLPAVRPVDPAVPAALTAPAGPTGPTGPTGQVTPTGAGEPDPAVLRFLDSVTVPDGRRLRDLAGEVQAVVVCLPDPWFRAAGGGAAARERLTTLVKDSLGLPAPRFLHRGSGIVAAASLGWTGTWLLAHAEAAVDLTLIEVTAHEIAVLGSWRGELPPGGAAPPSVPAETLHRYRFRAETVLPQALTTTRYRETPVYPGGDGTEWTTAGPLVDWYQPVAEAIRTGTRALLSDPPAALARRWSRQGGLRFALGGRLQAIPVAGDTMAEALPMAVRRSDEPTAMYDGAEAVYGAMAIAVQGLQVRQSSVVQAALTAHRVAGGRLRAETVPLTPANRPDGVSAYHRGELVAVEVDEPRPAQVDVETADAAGVRVRTTAVSREPVPAGRFHVGYWPDHGLGTLALRPVSGAPTLLLPLESAPEGKGIS